MIKRTIKIFQNKKGFSLVELVISILIMSTVFISLTQAFPYSMSIINEAKRKTEAGFLAQAKLEQISALNYEDIATGTPETRHHLGLANTELYSYERETVINCIDQDFNISETDLGLKAVTVNIYFANSISKREETIAINTLISKK